VPTTPVAANAALDRLDALVKGRDVPLAADLVRAIDDVARAQREFAETLDDAWRDREEKLLLRAFGDALDPTSQRRDAAVAEHAADALGGCRPAVAPPLRTEVAAVLEKDGVPPPSRAVLGAAFGSLARLGGDATFDWLARRITDSTRAADVRAARAAMGALAKFDGAGAMDRLSTASRIVRLLEPIEAAAADSKETEFRSLVAKTLVASLGAAGLEALEALATDRASGEPPWGADGTPFLTFAAWGKWLSSHRDASAAPWK
jgi:hypothetical protein